MSKVQHRLLSFAGIALLVAALIAGTSAEAEQGDCNGMLTDPVEYCHDETAWVTCNPYNTSPLDPSTGMPSGSTWACPGASDLVFQVSPGCHSDPFANNECYQSGVLTCYSPRICTAKAGTGGSEGNDSTLQCEDGGASGPPEITNHFHDEPESAPPL